MQGAPFDVAAPALERIRQLTDDARQLARQHAFPHLFNRMIFSVFESVPRQLPNPANLVRYERVFMRHNLPQRAEWLSDRPDWKNRLMRSSRRHSEAQADAVFGLIIAACGGAWKEGAIERQVNSRLPAPEDRFSSWSNPGMMKRMRPVAARAQHMDRAYRETLAAVQGTAALFMLRYAEKEKKTVFEDLAQMTPGFLPKPPADPFHPDHPLQLLRSGDTAVIYSRGPDLERASDDLRFTL